MRRTHRRLSACMILALSTSLYCLPVAGAPAQPKSAKHILVVIIDDVGVDMLSCYGEGADTPFMPTICQELRNRGLLLRNAWANPTCSPTRSTIQTGRYVFRNGVFAPGVPLSLNEQTIPEILKDGLNQQLGFVTAAFGKWHLSGTNFDNPPTCTVPGTPIDHGYDFFAGTRSNIGNYNNWCRILAKPTGFVSQLCTAGGGVQACAAQPYATIVNVNDAIGWIGQEQAPWFVWMAFNAPHSPFQAPPDQCPDGPCHGQTLPVPAGQNCPPGQGRPCYKAMLETLDTEIARLLEVVPADTNIIFLGDNGSPGQVVVPPFDPTRAKFTVYEGGVNVPMILAGPWVKPVLQGTETDTLVNAADIFAAVLETAGATLPAGLVTDSVSVTSLLDGTPAKKLRKYVFSERSNPVAVNYEKVARNERFKLLTRPNSSGTDAIEFYDLEGDPSANPPEAPDPFEDTDLFDDTNPNLTQTQQDNFDDLQEYFDFLEGLTPLCPATTGCVGFPPGSCQPSTLPPLCPTSSTGLTACNNNGGLFQCPAGEFIRVRNCNCVAVVPGALCLAQSQSWFCD